jgi:hypothetical protein
MVVSMFLSLCLTSVVSITRPLPRQWSLERPFSRRVLLDMIPYGVLQEKNGATISNMNQDVLYYDSSLNNKGRLYGGAAANLAPSDAAARFVYVQHTLLQMRSNNVLGVLGVPSDATELLGVLGYASARILIATNHVISNNNTSISMCRQHAPASYVYARVTMSSLLYAWTIAAYPAAEIAPQLYLVYTGLGHIGLTSVDVMCVYVSGDASGGDDDDEMWIDFSASSPLRPMENNFTQLFTTEFARWNPVSAPSVTSFIAAERLLHSSSRLLTVLDTVVEHDYLCSMSVAESTTAPEICINAVDDDLDEKTLLMPFAGVVVATSSPTALSLWSRLGINSFEFVQVDDASRVLNGSLITAVVVAPEQQDQQVTTTTVLGRSTLARHVSMLVYDIVNDSIVVFWKTDSASQHVGWAEGIALLFLFVLVWRRISDPILQNGFFSTYEIFMRYTRKQLKRVDMVGVAADAKLPATIQLLTDPLFTHTHIDYVIDVMVGIILVVAFVWCAARNSLNGPPDVSSMTPIHVWLYIVLAASVVFGTAALFTASIDAFKKDERLSKFNFFRAYGEWILWKTLWGFMRASVYPANAVIDTDTLPKDFLTRQQFIKFNGYTVAALTAIYLLSWNLANTFSYAVITAVLCALTAFSIYHAMENLFICLTALMVKSYGALWLQSLYTAYVIVISVLHWVFVQAHILLPFVFEVGVGIYSTRQLETVTLLFWGLILCLCLRNLSQTAIDYLQ